ncbi:hypothetical protein SM033_00285 [Vibrio phage vB_VpaM_sm033]|nr:hypothetical protein SM033_00285 [Vibrio phage vB_VpaM_sm033]
MKILMLDGPVEKGGSFASSRMCVLHDGQTDWLEVRDLMMRVLGMRCYKQTGEKPRFHEYRCNADKKEVSLSIGDCVHKCHLVPVPGLTDLASKLTQMQIDLDKKYAQSKG